jgi:hypothetical protein
MNLTPEQISQCIKNKDFVLAEQAIIDFILYNATEGTTLSFDSKSNFPQTQNFSQEDVFYQYCDLYANLISELFCAPGYRPSTATIGTFLNHKMILDWLFSGSMWKNTDALIDHIGLIKLDQFGRIINNFNEKRTTLLLMLISLSSKYKLPWQQFFKMTPAYALSAYIGLVTQPIPALSQESNAGFNHLLESAKDLPMFDLPVVGDLGKFNYGYFNCSYATSPDKYEFKKWLTSLIRHNLAQWLDNDIKDYIANIKPLKSKVKLKVAVMLELYSLNHAMYRCFNVALTRLSKKYQLTAFIDEKEVEGADLSIFDNVVTFKDVFNINENAKLVIQENPDIIFYPSIGMKFWGIYLSQLRLAPTQIMMPGHPSSSYSPEIDYCLLFGCSTSPESLQPYFSETLVIGKTPSQEVKIHTQHSALTKEFIFENNLFLNDDNEIKIAINGIMTKVTYTIIDVCKQIQKKSSKKVTFVFFSGHQPNQLAYLATKKQLSRDLKHFDLVCYSNYLSHMKTISECHFLLPTLPFGGANSNIDAMTLNKPKLFIEGHSHIYTRTDQWNWERVGLSRELGCATQEELINKSLQLINDNQYRKMIHGLMVKHCKLEKIYVAADDSKDIISDVFLTTIDIALRKSTSQ